VAAIEQVREQKRANKEAKEKEAAAVAPSRASNAQQNKMDDMYRMINEMSEKNYGTEVPNVTNISNTKNITNTLNALTQTLNTQTNYYQRRQTVTNITNILKQARPDLGTAAKIDELKKSITDLALQKKANLATKNIVTDLHRMTQDKIDEEAEAKEQREARRQGRKALRAKFVEAQGVLNDPTEEREAFRARILSVSLFPNVFNQETIMTSLGPS